MVLADIHCRTGLAVTFFSLALGIWGIIAYMRGSGVTGGYFGAIAIGEILVIGQGLIGVALLLSGAFPLDGLHFLYGILIPLTPVAVYVYTKGQTTRREILIYGIVFIFVMGLSVRGIMTGSAHPSCLPF
jgi:hypothetical protein